MVAETGKARLPGPMYCDNSKLGIVPSAGVSPNAKSELELFGKTIEEPLPKTGKFTRSEPEGLSNETVELALIDGKMEEEELFLTEARAEIAPTACHDTLSSRANPTLNRGMLNRSFQGVVRNPPVSSPTVSTSATLEVAMIPTTTKLRIKKLGSDMFMLRTDVRTRIDGSDTQSSVLH